MKLLKVKNPLTKEQTEEIEKYFKEEISCNCGVSFETDVRDYELETRQIEDGKANEIFEITTTLRCPSCVKIYSKRFVCKKEDIHNINIYRTYLNAKEQFKCKEQ